MLKPLTTVIDRLADELPAVLCPPEALHRLKAFAERFPEVKGHTIGPARLGIVGLELRLAASASQVDLTFPILLEDRTILLRIADDPDEGAWLREDPVWSRVWRFCRRWADPNTDVGRNVKLLWLEFDMAASAVPSAGLPSPGVFVGFDPDVTARAGPATWRRILCDVVTILSGTAPQEGLLDDLERFVRLLPADAYVQYVGLMLSRESDVVRLVAGRLPESEVPLFLAALGWCGDRGALTEMLADLGVRDGVRLHPGPSGVHIDVSTRPSSRIGLEYNLDRSAQARGRIEEREFLQRLADRRLCSPEKLDALLAVPGESVTVWQGRCEVGHARQIHHVKVVVDSVGLVQAKAYYGRSLVIRPLAGGP